MRTSPLVRDTESDNRRRGDRLCAVATGAGMNPVELNDVEHKCECYAEIVSPKVTYIKQASMPLYASRANNSFFPPPASSAGVPKRTNLPGRLCCFKAAATPIAAAQPEMEIRLCPQAWPMPASASTADSTSVSGFGFRD